MAKVIFICGKCKAEFGYKCQGVHLFPAVRCEVCKKRVGTARIYTKTKSRSTTEGKSNAVRDGG